MRKWLLTAAAATMAPALASCGTAIPQIPEVWDLIADTQATQHMEMQIKQSIFCELRTAIKLARKQYQTKISYHGKIVSTAEDEPVPDDWSAQVTLTFTVDEQSKITPGATLLWPYKPPLAATDSFSLGFGGQVSSDANRIDKYETFYTVAELANTLSNYDNCSVPPTTRLGPPSHSSPFVILDDLGITKWLPAASEVTAYLRSSRAAPNGEGPPLGGSFASDSFSYDVKFVIVSDGNVTPSWKLMKVTTSTSTFFDTSRTRTHELLITIGPGQTSTVTNAKGQKVKVTTAPSTAAANSHLAQEIGSAVATSLRPVLTGQ